MDNPTRTYFLRTRNRSRILATLVCQIVDGRLAFGIAKAPRSESSPSRKDGRATATRRLSEALAAFQNGEKFVYRRPHAKRDDPSNPPRGQFDVMGGVLNLEEVVPTLHDLLLVDLFVYVPEWAVEQDGDCLGHLPSYHDMLCKLRNCVERGKF
jgi:hypothetical protein